MKFFIFLSCLFFCLSLNAGTPILSITKSNGGKRGYWFVSAQTGNSSSGESGWHINCYDPGREDCRPPMNSAPPGEVSIEEFEKALELVTHAEDQWDNGVINGTYTDSFIEVSGVHKNLEVTWWVEDRIIHIIVERIDE